MLNIQPCYDRPLEWPDSMKASPEYCSFKRELDPAAWALTALLEELYDSQYCNHERIDAAFYVLCEHHDIDPDWIKDGAVFLHEREVYMTQANALVKQDTSHDPLEQIFNLEKAVNTLVKYPAYRKVGEEQLMLRIAKGLTMGISPLRAIDGFSSINGKTEMSAELMNQLIRSKGHSIMKDSKSNDKFCTVTGRRADNGDTMTVTFSMEDAERANLVRKGSPWQMYPQSMLWARALSILARQLFADVIHGCYVEGEISSALEGSSQPSHPVDELVQYTTVEVPTEAKKSTPEKISDEQAVELAELLVNCSTEYREKFERSMANNGVERLSDMPVTIYERALRNTRQNALDYQAELENAAVAQEHEEETLPTFEELHEEAEEWEKAEL